MDDRPVFAGRGVVAGKTGRGVGSECDEHEGPVAAGEAWERLDSGTGQRGGPRAGDVGLDRHGSSGGEPVGPGTPADRSVRVFLVAVLVTEDDLGRTGAENGLALFFRKTGLGLGIDLRLDHFDTVGAESGLEV